ncbi:hypothetical protein CELL_01767 [Cellulomonas sp. T2.31MG-18]|uniref:AAA family ATPase n=1 Tax=Cellulomonas sp. T2.31MG-18 TaxID=3157619 RepID=UPI0035ECA449
MRHSELAQVLRAANPWWSRRTRVSWAVDDVHLAQRARHEWLTGTLAGRAALSDVAHTPAGTATVLVGPRGVGKTTAAKDAVVQALAEPDLDARAVLWVPVEATPDDPFPDRPALDAQDLDNALRRPTRVGAPACDQPRLVVLDEASACGDWADVLATPVPGVRVLVTASLGGAAVERVQAGWEGAATVRSLRPSTLAELLGAQPGADARTVREEYLRYGGFARAVAERRDLGDVSTAFVDLLAEGLRRDVCIGDGSAPCPIERLFVAVCSTTGRFVEPAEIAVDLGIPAEQVGHLLDRLADAGVLDPRRGFVDPLLHLLPSLRDPSLPHPSQEHVATYSF